MTPNANQRLAIANQEKIKEKMLYYKVNQLRSLKKSLKAKYQELNLEEDLAENSMSRLVKHVEMYKGILNKNLFRLAR